MSSTVPVFVVGAARTPIGAFRGTLASVPAPALGAVAIRAALARAGAPADAIDAAYVGNVLSAGVGQAPARQAALGAGLPQGVPCTTIGKVCGSGLMSVVCGARAIRLGEAELVVAGGMESMSRAPHALLRAREGYRMGNAELVDLMLLDGLWDPYNDFHMGSAAELCAREHGIGRAEQDAFARASYEKALAAQRSGRFAEEIAPVVVKEKKGEREVREDEEPGRAELAKMDALRPAFDPAGTITAANASKIDDGAAAVVLASARAVERHRLTPLARIVAHAEHAQAPERFPTAPVGAIEKAVARAKLSTGEIDLWEINEAFAVVGLACTKLAGIPPERVNVRGGAVALGHPIGASGTRILVTLVHAMKERSARRGLATACIGGGEALALIVERP